MDTLAPHPHAFAWHLIHTKPRSEELAQTNLERQGFRCYLPRLSVEKVRRGKAQVVSEPLFPRYLFVQLDSSGQGQSWAPIRSTLGVHSLVRFGSHPAKVDDAMVCQLRERESAFPVATLFEPGDKVQIIAGAFAGLEAIYQEADAERRSMILLEILSKPVSMQIDTALLQKAL